MSKQLIYKFLVPDAPPDRRTAHDGHEEHREERRLRANAFAAGLQPGLQRPSLVSSYAGAIETLLLAFPRYGVDSAAFSAGYRSLIREIRPGTQFVIAHHQSTQSQIAEWFAAAGHASESVSYVPLPDDVAFTHWAEDPYVALVDTADRQSYLMEPWEFLRQGDALIADAVEGFHGLTASQAPLIFQGGNCLVGDDFWLLGKDYFIDTVSLLSSDDPPMNRPSETTYEQFARDLFSRFADSSRQLLLVGTSESIALRPYRGIRTDGEYVLDIVDGGVGRYQPIFHIDMFITLVGRNSANEFEVLVGSPTLADEILGSSSPYGLGGVYDGIASDLDAAGFKVDRIPLVHQPTRQPSKRLDELRQQATEQDSEDLAFAVRELVAAGAQDATPIVVRDWHHLTWNNCLVENSAAVGKHVYLPTFGHGPHTHLAQIDRLIEACWRHRGFTVHMLGDFNEFARRQGVVHCIKKYLGRGQ